MDDLNAMLIERQCLRLVHDYFHNISPLDIEGVVGLFAEDGIVERRGAQMKGQVAIREFLEGSQSRGKLYMGQNIRIKVRDADTAEGSCLAFVVASTDHADRPLPSGAIVHILRYADEYRRTDAGWRFAYRKVGKVLDNEGL